MLAINQLAGFGSASLEIETFTLVSSGLATWTDAKTATLISDTTGWNNTNMRHVISSLSAGGSAVRMVFAGGLDGGITYDDLYIGEQALSGDIYDMKASVPAPTQMFVGGSGSFVVPEDETVTTDELVFAVDSSKTYVIAAHLSSYLGSDSLKQGSGLVGVNSYYITGASQSSSADATGSYTGAGSARGVSKMQVRTATNDDVFFAPTVTQ